MPMTLGCSAGASEQGINKQLVELTTYTYRHSCTHQVTMRSASMHIKRTQQVSHTPTVLRNNSTLVQQTIKNCICMRATKTARHQLVTRSADCCLPQAGVLPNSCSEIDTYQLLCTVARAATTLVTLTDQSTAVSTDIAVEYQLG